MTYFSSELALKRHLVSSARLPKGRSWLKSAPRLDERAWSHGSDECLLVDWTDLIP